MIFLFRTFKATSECPEKGAKKTEKEKRLLVRGHHLLILSLILLDRKTRETEKQEQMTKQDKIIAKRTTKYTT